MAPIEFLKLVAEQAIEVDSFAKVVDGHGVFGTITNLNEEKLQGFVTCSF